MGLSTAYPHAWRFGQLTRPSPGYPSTPYPLIIQLCLIVCTCEAERARVYMPRKTREDGGCSVAMGKLSSLSRYGFLRDDHHISHLCSYKEARQTHWLPRVNVTGIRPQFVVKTLGTGVVDIAFVSPRKGILATLGATSRIGQN